MEKKILTLCVVYDDKHILLGMKKRGFGMGRWNGFGGKVEEGESIDEAAKRELLEEAGIKADTLKKRGVLQFSFKDGSAPPLEVHVYSAHSFKGELMESDEMKPQWFLHSDIPYTDMWPDDIHWLPKVLVGKNIEGEFRFKDANTILHQEIREV
ncbi:MAG: 7,8-dihydro-8-oxoguanine triphosphatase [Parcubacteria group bacterium Gr01-1014_70]|nr:MAG: 7,8-dihydro-8-oxoguanine triphosphatase [Parcubacteria group bacterium Gr01-1014_70]